MLGLHLLVVLVASFLLGGYGTAMADWPVTFVRAQCLSQINRFSLETFTDWNLNPPVEAAMRQGIYAVPEFLKLYQSQPLQCDLGGGVVIFVTTQLESHDKLGAPELRFMIGTSQFPIAQLGPGDDDTSFYVARADFSKLNMPDSLRWEACDFQRDTPLDWPTIIQCRRGEVSSDGHRDRADQEIEFEPRPPNP